MPKLTLNTTRNYSPNFDVRKRNNKEIKFLIFHYTGMSSEKNAINRLTNFNSKVSCHYFIKNDGKILSIVPDLYVSWHSGISKWKKYKSLNKTSIGIEINNPGHNLNYKKFSRKQIISILNLSKMLTKKYRIKSKNILGHSDIAPTRKKDPGEKFPWEYLSKNNIGIWHNLSKRNLLNKRKKKISNLKKNLFIQNLFKIGYPQDKSINKIKYSKILTKAFQRRFRQELINGIIDQECLNISTDLLKKF